MTVNSLFINTNNFYFFNTVVHVLYCVSLQYCSVLNMPHGVNLTGVHMNLKKAS